MGGKFHKPGSAYRSGCGWQAPAQGKMETAKNWRQPKTRTWRLSSAGLEILRIPHALSHICLQATQGRPGRTAGALLNC